MGALMHLRRKTEAGGRGEVTARVNPGDIAVGHALY